MEFKFNVNDVFKQPIVEVNQNLIPPGFSGDRRALWDTVGKVSEVVNAMGEASATAQGLSKPITTAERLRNSEHKLYFLVDQAANDGKGSVVGMLKTGQKGLYVFDREGQHYKVSPPCVLDFYVHESRQRAGLGRQLFEHMLKKEEIDPVKMAIDRPSEKFLGFLNKHYTLNTPVKQMNNFVVFDGFFPKSAEKEKSNLIEPDNSTSTASRKKESANGLQSVSSPYGRYGAPRPPCSMGQIIHNQTSTINKGQDATGVQSMPATNYQGMQNISPNLNNNSQSTPNMNYDGRILNNADQNQNAMMLNRNQQQNQMNQAYNMQPNSVMMNGMNQNQIPSNNYQGYQNMGNIEPTANMVPSNLSGQYALPTNAVGQYYSGQNVPSQYLTQNPPNGLQYSNSQIAPNTGMIDSQNQMVATNQIGRQGDVPQAQSYGSHTIQNIQQENLQHQQAPQLTMTNQWLAPNVVYSQPTMHNQNYTTNEQNQQIQNQNVIKAAPQSYNIPNQQYNQQLNNQVYSQELIANRNMVNTAQSINAGITPQVQNIQPNPNMIMPTHMTIPRAAGDNLQQSVTDQTQWVQQNQPNPNQYQTYMQTNAGGVASNVQSAPYINTMQTGQVGTPLNYPMQASMPMIPAQPHVVNQNQTPQVYLTNQNKVVHSEPHIPVNTMNQQALTPQPNVDIRKFVSNPAMQVPNPHNLQQAHGQSVPNIPREQMPPSMYHNYNTNNIIPNAAPMPVQGIASQVYNPQVQMSAQQVNSQVNPTPQQNVTTVNRQNMPVGTYSTPNMSQGDHIANAQMNERNNKNNELNNSAQDDMKQDANSRNDGKGDAKRIEEEGTLLYGYPPQCPSLPFNDEKSDGEKPHHSPKLERPRSLSIQQSEEQPEEKNLSDLDSQTTQHDNVNEAQKNIQVKGEDEVTGKLPSSDAENISMGKRTPSHLTEQGYLDLKFYHNKLW